MQLWLLIILLFFIECEFLNLTNNCPNTKASIASLRKRRHLTFPNGYNVVLTISLVKGYLTHAPSGWNLSLEMDVLFSLPDANFTNAHFRRKLHHRQKRQFWEKISNAFDCYNFNGRECLMRSICDAKEYLAPPGKSLVHDLLRGIFVAPINEADFDSEVRDYNDLLASNACEKTHDCPISLVQLMLSLNHLKY